jgi:hypothetical protein
MIKDTDGTTISSRPNMALKLTAKTLAPFARSSPLAFGVIAVKKRRYNHEHH